MKLSTVLVYFLQFKLTVYRPVNVEMSTLTVDLAKKPGKGLGLSIISMKKGSGVYISEIVSIIQMNVLWLVAFLFTTQFTREKYRKNNIQPLYCTTESFLNKCAFLLK